METLKTGQAPSSIFGIEERWANVDGARMRYLCGGSGPALVLLHGLLGYSFSWRFNLPALARHTSVYAVDMLGTGYSDRATGLDYSLGASAARFLRFLDQVGISSCDLLGTSQGGAVAMMVTASCPERVRRLILVAPVNPWSGHGRLLAPFLGSRLIAPLVCLLPRLDVAHGLVLRRLYGDTRRISPGTLEGYSAPFAIPGTVQYAVTVLRSWNRDLRELGAALPRIAEIPTLLLWGSRDAAVNPASAAQLRQQFKDCRVMIWPGVGHLPYEEVPDEFNRAVLEFLARAPPSRER